jgi:hypothetical protein
MALKHFLTMSIYHTRSDIVYSIFSKHNWEKYNKNLSLTLPSREAMMAHREAVVAHW